MKLTQTKTVAYGLVSKGNGEAWLILEKHTSLATGGGQAGQGYPCILIADETIDRHDSRPSDSED